MKKNNVVWYCCAVVALGVLCGCETVTVPPRPPTVPDNSNALEIATSQLISKMRLSHAFNRNLDGLVKAKGRRPVIVVGKIDTLLHATRLDSEIVRNCIQASLNESGLFTMNMDGFDEAVDYQVTGYIKSDYDAANPDHDANTRLYLRLLDINSGQVIWDGTQYNLRL